MKTLPITGTLRTVSFHEDDTIETVRQLIALSVNSHPDRLFMEVKTTLPADYYATNPKHWSELFFRLSYDGSRIRSDVLRTYITQIRPTADIAERDVTREEWDNRAEFLKPLFAPEKEFTEWRVLGVALPFVLPLPPRDLPDLKAAYIPLPKRQSLFETIHPYGVTEIRATEVTSAVSEITKRVYYPYLLDTTPSNIEGLRAPILAAQANLEKLMSLNAPRHAPPNILRAKWYVPLISTQFAAPRVRFEQMFYGMTVSKDTPHIAYFTARTEAVRHKFYVEDPKKKEPLLKTSLLKHWYTHTQPQRKLPTLLLYRGDSRTSFDRIAITPKDITLTVNRDKTSTESLEELRHGIEMWLKSLDALLPFLTLSDIEKTRWELSDVSVMSTYSKEIHEFDMHRFACLQTLFGYQNDSFRLLRTEAATEDVTPLEVQAFQILNQEDAEPSAELLAKELNMTQRDAENLYAQIRERGEDFDYEKTIRAYPVIKFSSKEVILKFVSNLDRTLEYADILRYVLTSSNEEIDSVCPRRMEVIAPKVVEPQREIDLEAEFDPDDEFAELMGLAPAAPAAQPAAEEEGPKAKKVQIKTKPTTTFNYFNARLHKFDPDTFEKDYPQKCEKSKQVIVLTPEDQARIGETYNYSKASPEEVLQMEDPTGVAICPPYWCMRDEIPLTEDQLVPGDDGELHCPVCNGKIRTNETQNATEFPLLKREALNKYPRFLTKSQSSKKKKIPCCYQQKPSTKEILAVREDETYILSSTNLPSLRLGYISESLAETLKVETQYKETIKNGKLIQDKTDVFRVGIGRPSQTLPTLLKSKVKIPRPGDAEGRDAVMACSFFRTWKYADAEGDTETDRIIYSIDRAFEDGTLDVQNELEYTCYFLKCEVIRIHTADNKIMCSYWADRLRADALTICMLDNDILASVTRKKKPKITNEFVVDLRVKPFVTNTLSFLREQNRQACSINLPTLSDAIDELRLQGKPTYEFILDPFERVQAVFVPREVILPVTPSATDEQAPKRTYGTIPEEDIPVAATVEAFLEKTKRPGFKKTRDVYDARGQKVELELSSGFRIPVKAEPGKSDEVGEVLETLQKHGEKMLVDDPPNKEDIALAQNITYSAEVYEFLLYSLSKDVQEDDHAELRASILNKKVTLYKDLTKWFKERAYEDATKSPVEFVNKVRTPCGQYTEKGACNSSSLCGWTKGVCKIRVKPILEKEALLKRIAKTLQTNDKQRALVLDGRLSPFFSTVLYLEMPHEWITTSV